MICLFKLSQAIVVFQVKTDCENIRNSGQLLLFEKLNKLFNLQIMCYKTGAVTKDRN